MNDVQDRLAQGLASALAHAQGHPVPGTVEHTGTTPTADTEDKTGFRSTRPSLASVIACAVMNLSWSREGLPTDDDNDAFANRHSDIQNIVEAALVSDVGGEAALREALIPFVPNYRHIKTGGLYQTLDVVTNATNAQNGVPMMLYRSAPDANGWPGRTFVRERSEFDDGRFERLDRAAAPAAPTVPGDAQTRLAEIETLLADHEKSKGLPPSGRVVDQVRALIASSQKAEPSGRVTRGYVCPKCSILRGMPPACKQEGCPTLDLEGNIRQWDADKKSGE